MYSPAPGRGASLAGRTSWVLLYALLLATFLVALLGIPGRIPVPAPRELTPADWIPDAAASAWPARGAAVLNALVLGGAALLAARVLSRKVGPAAPSWVAVWLFGSVAFAHVFQPGGGLVLLAATLAGFALVYLDESGTGTPRKGPLPQVYGG